MSADLIFTRPIVKGSGAEKQENCSVELLGLAIYGDYRHGFHLPCIDPGAQAATVAVNDSLSKPTLQTRRWRLLVARLGTCHNTHSARLERRMALWVARSVEHLSDDPRVKACNDTTERWLAGEATDEELAGAAKAAKAAKAAGAAEAAWAAWAAEAAWAAWAAAAAEAAGAAEAAEAAGAAGAAGAAYEDALMEWLDSYLTAWAKTAADEGLMVPEDMEDEYVRFVEALDFSVGGDDTRSDDDET